MNTKCSFLIVCLSMFFAACHTPRQVVLKETVEVPVHVRDTVEVPVPVYRDTGSVVILPAGNYDSLFFEWEKIWTEVIMSQDTTTKKRTYKVTSGTRPDTVTVYVTIQDTVPVEIEKDCPPTLPLPAAPSGGGFPWGALVFFLGLLAVWWSGRKSKNSN